jgi:hypothetical protein
MYLCCLSLFSVWLYQSERYIELINSHHDGIHWRVKSNFEALLLPLAFLSLPQEALYLPTFSH